MDFNAEQVQSPLSNLACNGAIADINIDSEAQLKMPAMGCERVLAYIHTGSITAAGQKYEAGQLLVLDGDSAIIATTDQPSGLLLLRGEPLRQPIAHGSIRYEYTSPVTGCYPRLSKRAIRTIITIGGYLYGFTREWKVADKWYDTDSER